LFYSRKRVYLLKRRCCGARAGRIAWENGPFGPRGMRNRMPALRKRREFICRRILRERRRQSNSRIARYNAPHSRFLITSSSKHQENIDQTNAVS
jgi:hypothetical protein